MLGNHHLPVQLMLVYELHLLGTNPLAFWQHGQAVTDTATATPVGSCKCYMQSLLQGKLNGAEFEPQSLKEIIIFISLRSMTPEKATQPTFLTVCNITYLDSKQFISLQA